ncbi:MAG: lysylphosphatidylglycerol synthase transmembrane domain-containing protein [Candidatus Omnitrophota bacterium]|nr:lysylphosphatidylglycerol synthase transmembrane domain-containing protein [Candidatus Omnitrophota bacterium]
MKKRFSAILRIVISLGLLGFLFWFMRSDFQDIWKIILTCNTRFIAIALFFVVWMLLALSWRLKVVFDGEDLKISLNEAFQLTCVGYFFNNFMPTAVGGDIVKAHYAANFNKQRLKSYASVLMDRIIGMCTVLIIAAVALTVDKGRFQADMLRPLVVVLLVLGVAAVLIATNRSMAIFMERFLMRIKMFGLGERLRAVYSIVHDYRNRKDVVTKSVVFSTIAQSVYYIIVFFLFLSLGKNVNLGNVFLVMPVVIFISMIPSIGGLGVREGAMVAFFAPLAGKEIAFAASLLLLAVLFLISIVGGIVYIWWGLSGTYSEKGEGEG